MALLYLIKDENIVKICWKADVETDIFIDTIVVCILSAEESEKADKVDFKDVVPSSPEVEIPKEIES